MTQLDVRKLMQIHVEALYTSDEHGRLLYVNVPGAKPAARFFLGRTALGRVTRFRQDVTSDLVRDLEEASAKEAGDVFAESPHNATIYESLLARAEPVTRVESGPSYCFSEHLGQSDALLIRDPDQLTTYLPEWREDMTVGQPMFGVVVDDAVVSLCASVRKTQVAHEAGVETAKAFRGQGYAARAVAAWARAVRDMGRVPLYSTSWANESSRALAAKLQLIRYGTTLHIT